MEKAKEFENYFNDSKLNEQQQLLLRKVRDIVHVYYPDVIERTSYAMPGFFPVESKKATEVLFMVMAAKNHLGIYALPEFNLKYQDELNDLDIKFGKGSIQIPYDIKDSYLKSLIKKIIKENLAKNNFAIPKELK